jgi:hypothetical protein
MTRVVEQLDLDLGDVRRLVKGPDGMVYLLPEGDTLAAMRAEYPGTRLDVVPWLPRLRFQ